MNHIGKTIKHLRTKNQMTQEELAKALDCSRRWVATIENGKGQPTIKMILGIIRVFNVSADYLLGLEAPSSDVRKVEILGGKLEIVIKKL